MKGERRKKFNSLRQITAAEWPLVAVLISFSTPGKKGGDNEPSETRSRTFWNAIGVALSAAGLEPEAAGVSAPNIEHFGDRLYWNKKPLWSRSNFFRLLERFASKWL
jgi:hypothetical protein